MEIRLESGTTFIDTQCYACGQLFRQLPSQAVVYAGYPNPERLGDLCPHCAGSDGDALRLKLQQRAAAYRQLAAEIERLADEAITLS
jgi:hypothetical protein